MEGLPKLPGMSFENRIKLNHHLSHSLNYRNGYRIPKKPPCSIGRDPLNEDSIQFPCGINDTAPYDPVLTYGRVKHPVVAPFRPHFVTYDKMVLQFFAFFKQSVPESPHENYRVRQVKILYFLEDDSMTVMEPSIRNAGFTQGRLIRRGKIPKNTKFDYYTWKDLNLGIDIELNGIVFHITDCDLFTRDFMLSQGIEMNDAECLPSDPATTDRFINSDMPKTRTSTVTDDKLKKYLQYQGQVLHFDCILDESDRPHGECLTYKLFYYLEDDTVAIKELRENREGRDPFPMLLKKTKLPKNWRQQPATFPSIFLEITDSEVAEYYQPQDFKVGETIFVFGRRFLLLDCDRFTRQYFDDVLKITQGPKMEIKFPTKPQPIRPLPKYIGPGTPEDTLGSCFRLIPKEPKKDIVTYLLNANKYLRYECVLDTAYPEDQIRRFILQYSLANGTITIVEPPIRNSGIIGGKFLGATKIWRHGCDPNNPEYYTTKDIYIGAILIVNAHRFKVVGADLYVYRYMQQHPELFTAEIVESVRNYHLLNGNLNEDLECALALQEKSHEMQQNQISVTKEPTDQEEIEECLRRINVVKGHELEENNIPLLERERTPNWSGDSTKCPYIVKTPKILSDEMSKPPVDSCEDRIVSAICCRNNENNNNPHKIVRFETDDPKN